MCVPSNSPNGKQTVQSLVDNSIIRLKVVTFVTQVFKPKYLSLKAGQKTVIVKPDFMRQLTAVLGRFIFTRFYFDVVIDQ